MIKGTYKVYQEGKLIGEYENKLTEVGRILALKTLMGAVPSFAGSLSIGIDGTANTLSGDFASNKRLGFKVCSSPVLSANVGLSGSSDALVFKARIDDPSAYKIYEIGLFSDPLPGGATTNRMENLLNFEGSDNLTETDGSALLTATAELIDSTYATYGSLFRNGNTALLVKSTKTVKSNNSFSGLETFNNTDLLNVSYYADANADLTIVFYSNSATMTYATPFAYTGSAAYRVVSTPISSGVLGGTGTFSWSNITEIRFSAASGNILLDGVRFENADITDTNNGMVSRTSLTSPISKVDSIPLDIEYYLRVDFNG